MKPKRGISLIMIINIIKLINYINKKLNFLIGSHRTNYLHNVVPFHGHLTPHKYIQETE